MRATLLLGVLVLLITAAGIFVQSGPGTPSLPPSGPPSEPRPATGKVAVPEPSPQALAYHRSGNLLWVVGSIWGLFVPAVLLFAGVSARGRDWARRVGRRWFFVIGLYFVAFAAIVFLIDLPLSFYEGFVRQHAYGLSNQTFGKWARDEVTSLMVGMVGGVLFMWVPYLLLKKSPRRWWLY